MTVIDFVAANAVAGRLTVTLPSAIGRADDRITIKKIDLSVNPVTVATTAGQTIEMLPTHWLVAFGQYVTVVSDGANWWVIDSNYPGLELGWCEEMASLATTNALVTDAALSNEANTLPCLTITTIGAGRPVQVKFKGAAATANTLYFIGATLLVNGSQLLGDSWAHAPGPGAGSWGTLSAETTTPLPLVAGTSYTFQVGVWVQSSSSGGFFAENQGVVSGTAVPKVNNTLQVVGA